MLDWKAACSCNHEQSLRSDRGEWTMGDVGSARISRWTSTRRNRELANRRGRLDRARFLRCRGGRGTSTTSSTGSWLRLVSRVSARASMRRQWSSPMRMCLLRVFATAVFPLETFRFPHDSRDKPLPYCAASVADSSRRRPDSGRIRPDHRATRLVALMVERRWARDQIGSSSRKRAIKLVARSLTCRATH